MKAFAKGRRPRKQSMYYSENEGSGLEETKQEDFSGFAKIESPDHDSSENLNFGQDNPIRLADLSSLRPSQK